MDKANLLADLWTRWRRRRRRRSNRFRRSLGRNWRGNFFRSWCRRDRDYRSWRYNRRLFDGRRTDMRGLGPDFYQRRRRRHRRRRFGWRRSGLDRNWNRWWRRMESGELAFEKLSGDFVERTRRHPCRRNAQFLRLGEDFLVLDPKLLCNVVNTNGHKNYLPTELSETSMAGQPSS